MDTEVKRTELRLSADPRLRAGVRAALEHFGEHHGLSKEEQREFASAAEEQCAKVLASAEQTHPECAVIIDEREDCIEVTIERADAGDKGTEKIAARAGRNGSESAKIVKHFHRNPAHS